MPNHVHTETHCQLFPDDTPLYRVMETISGQVQLQQNLMHLEQWAADWGMVFNTPKCYIMSINKGKTLNPHFYELCGVVLNSGDLLKISRSDSVTGLVLEFSHQLRQL